MVSASNYEYEILSLLWGQGRGLTALEINSLSDTLEKKSWKNTSIHPILANMVIKELVFVDGVTLVGKHYSRVFHAAITAEEYSIVQINENISSSQNKQKSLQNIFASLLDNVEVGQDTIDEIEELLRKKRKGL